MGLDLQSLKLQFKEYLINEGIIDEFADDAYIETNVSIFEYKDEFKDFVEKKFEIGLDNHSFSLSEVLELEIENGSFVLDEFNEQTNKVDDVVEDNYADKEESEIKVTQENFLPVFLNMLFKDEEFLKNADDDGVLEDDETRKFLAWTSWNGDDALTLTFDDVLEAYARAEDGGFKEDFVSQEYIDGFMRENLDETSEDTNSTDEVNKTSVASYNTSSSSGGGGIVNTNNSTNNIPKKTEITDPSKMSHSQLLSTKDAKTEELNKAQESFDANKKNISETADKQKATLEEVFKNETKVDQEVKQAVLDYYTQAHELTSNITDRKIQIADLEVEIYSLKSELSVAETNLSAYQNALASISDDDPEADAKKTYFDGLIAALEPKIEALKADIPKKEAQKADAESEQGKLEQQLIDLNAAFIEKQEGFSEAISNFSEEATEALSNYSNSISDLEKVGDEYLDKIVTLKIYLQDVEAEIIKSDVKKDIAANSSSNIFASESAEYVWTDYTGETKMPYGIYAPENLDDTSKVPVMVFLHGKGMIGANETRAARGYIEQNFKDYELNAFNGLIVCPQSTDYWNGKAADIDEILNDVASKYNIDPDNIVIAGHSAGGTGVINTLDSDVFKDGVGFEFRSGVCFAGYPRWTVDQNPGTEEEKMLDLAAPVYVYADDATIKSEFDEKVTNVAEWIDRKGTAHGKLAYLGFREDFDGNGRADILEKLFGTQE